MADPARRAAGLARAASLTPERRKEIAAKGAAVRWGRTARRAPTAPLRRCPTELAEFLARCLPQLDCMADCGLHLEGGEDPGDLFLAIAMRLGITEFYGDGGLVKMQARLRGEPQA